MADASRFDRDTALRALGAQGAPEGSARGEEAFEARLDGGWWIRHGPNGGYLAAIVTRALQAATADPARQPRSLTLHYLRAPAEGAVRIEVTRERVGGRMTTLSARVLQDERLVVLALGALSRDREGPALHHAAMPEAPPPEECPTQEPADGGIPLRARFETRVPPSAPGRGQAVSLAWIRLAEARRVDPPLVAAYTDALVPALYALSGPERIGGLPTVDLTIHFRTPTPLPDARPDDFCLGVFRSRLAQDGFVEEDGEVWSRDGRLLAQSRQLAVVTGR